MTVSPDAAVVQEFLRAVGAKDWPAARATLNEDVVWTLPGTGPISGEAHGPTAVLDRARTITSANVTIEPQHLHLGYRSIAVTVHNTARRADAELDEWLAIVFTCRDGRITTIDTHISDVPMMERFFAV
ncbi:nuclear transport factor 2 family protein [Nocardia arthritidis]|uniref:Nuclear transport factor 2 family protein n=1 Tax=Nocardia arthritidis TaxID=228602 RepID=A0A6G9YLH8_9NOCA|nr:nuclear transport factor 2 family protein [Nocardia arthritidis]QIS14129.1 nuclear transport factor 2 family protein [Nocardia arthritidis]